MVPERGQTPTQGTLSRCPLSFHLLGNRKALYNWELVSHLYKARNGSVAWFRPLPSVGSGRQPQRLRLSKQHVRGYNVVCGL